MDYLLVGKVRWEKADSAQSRVRVSPELIEVAGSTTRWQQPFDAVLSDVFQVQGEIAGKVAQALDVALGAPEKARLDERPDPEPRGLGRLSPGRGRIEAHARDRAERPGARRRGLRAGGGARLGLRAAWGRLSQVYSSRYANGVPTPEGASRALAAAQRALALAPDAAEPRLALGTYYDFITGEYAKALEQFAMGRRADPNNAELTLGGGAVGAEPGAVGELARLPEAGRGPRPAVVPGDLPAWPGPTSGFAGRRGESAAADRGLGLAPTGISIHQHKAMALLGKGDLAGARAVLRAVPPRWTRPSRGPVRQLLGHGLAAG